MSFNPPDWAWALYEYLHNLNHLTRSEHFFLTVAVENYIQPRRYTCSLCMDEPSYRARKGCHGELAQRVGKFKTQKCPGNYLLNIDYLLEWYTRWKRCADFRDEPAKLIDIFYFIDNRVEAEKERLRKEAERRQKTRGLARGHNAKGKRRR